ACHVRGRLDVPDLVPGGDRHRRPGQGDEGGAPSALGAGARAAGRSAVRLDLTPRARRIAGGAGPARAAPGPARRPPPSPPGAPPPEPPPPPPHRGSVPSPRRLLPELPVPPPRAFGRRRRSFHGRGDGGDPGLGGVRGRVPGRPRGSLLRDAARE